MPVVKNKETKKWEVFIRYKNIYGKNSRKHKSGFKTQTEAKNWEREFLNTVNYSSNVMFSTVYKSYLEDASKRVKITTINTRKASFVKYILPVFGNMPLNTITPLSIRNFQNDLLKKNFSKNYLKMIESCLILVFRYAEKYFNLKENPMKNYETVGSRKSKKEMNIWNLDTFNIFSEKISNNKKYHTLFNLLFWSRARIGEILALQIKDIDFSKNKIDINKTYVRLNKKEFFHPPKTESSVRNIEIPKNIMKLLEDYIQTLYNPTNDTRIFQNSINSTRFFLYRIIQKHSLPAIRLHDFRHSHASLLVHNGINIVAISKRLGHTDIKTTFNTYIHLYEEENKKLVSKLNELTLE